jgi:hypothetical protein
VTTAFLGAKQEGLATSREASDAGEFHLKTKSRDFLVIFDEK